MRNGLNKRKKSVVLPRKRTKPRTSLNDYSLLLYGEKKIGKTSLAAKFPTALMLFFEAGGKSLDCYQVPEDSSEVMDWEDFLEVIKQLKTVKHPFKTVVIDTVDWCYKACFDYCCKRYNFSHPGDVNDFGKSWGLIKDHFSKAINELLSMETGIVFISHSQFKEVKSRNGLKYDRIVPTLAKQAGEVLAGLVDSMFYYDKNDGRRELVLQGDDLVTAGTRIDFAFLDSKTNKPLEFIPMGPSAKTAFSQLRKAFRNELTNQPPPKKKTATLPKKKG